MAASVKSTAKSAKATSSSKSPVKPPQLLELLLARAPAEDLAGYGPGMLERAAHLAEQAVLKHTKGSSVIDIETEAGVIRHGRPVAVVTVVNDNMPFLFDSLIGEITDAAGEPVLVTHPVIAVRHGRSGVDEIVSDGVGHKGEQATDKVSVIHVHIAQLGKDAAQALRERLNKLLGQVRAAVTDWKPMLARLDQAISEFRYAPIPLDKNAVAEAIAFLEWLRDDNFTFLGMREFDYSRRREERHARARRQARASASWPIRTCWCCAAARSTPSRRRPKSGPSCTGRIR